LPARRSRREFSSQGALAASRPAPGASIVITCPVALEGKDRADALLDARAELLAQGYRRAWLGGQTVDLDQIERASGASGEDGEGGDNGNDSEGGGDGSEGNDSEGGGVGGVGGVGPAAVDSVLHVIADRTRGQRRATRPRGRGARGGHAPRQGARPRVDPRHGRAHVAFALARVPALPARFPAGHAWPFLLQQPDRRVTLYVMDEPTTGLHRDDVARVIAVLHRLVDRGDTVVVIEHHPDVMVSADWILDLGPEGGERGGRVVACGAPERVARVAGSHTGAVIAAELTRAGGVG
jgi:hypothetical protein